MLNARAVQADANLDQGFYIDVRTVLDSDNNIGSLATYQDNGARAPRVVSLPLLSASVNMKFQ